MRKLPNVVFVALLVWGVIGCSSDDTTVSVNEIDFWVGAYDIHTIGGEQASCDIFYLLPETIVVQSDETFRVLTPCEEGGVIIEGSYVFRDGLFELYVDEILQEPEDLPEFEMQIFDDGNGDVRIYRCTYASGTCTLRLGTRAR